MFLMSRVRSEVRVGGYGYPVDGLLEAVGRSSVHLQMPQSVVVPRIHHGTEYRMLPDVRSKSQATLQYAIRGINLKKRDR